MAILLPYEWIAVWAITLGRLIGGGAVSVAGEAISALRNRSLTYLP